MISERELREMRPYVGALVAAVAAEDSEQIRVIYSRLQKEHRVDPEHALVVLLADELLRCRDRFARAVQDGTRYAEAYMDEKRRVAELRDILHHRKAAA